jgi:hypothetical protein
MRPTRLGRDLPWYREARPPARLRARSPLSRSPPPDSERRVARYPVEYVARRDERLVTGPRARRHRADPYPGRPRAWSLPESDLFLRPKGSPDPVLADGWGLARPLRLNAASLLVSGEVL